MSLNPYTWHATAEVFTTVDGKRLHPSHGSVFYRKEDRDAELAGYKRAVEWLSSLPELLTEADGTRYLLRAATATTRGQWEQVPADLRDIILGEQPGLRVSHGAPPPQNSCPCGAPPGAICKKPTCLMLPPPAPFIDPRPIPGLDQGQFLAACEAGNQVFGEGGTFGGTPE